MGEGLGLGRGSRVWGEGLRRAWGRAGVIFALTAFA